MKQNGYTWTSTINGVNYEFSYERVKGKHILTINGVPQVLKMGFMSAILGFDEAFDLNGLQARLVITKNQPDIVVNDTYLQSGKRYSPRPKWVLAFVILCVAIPIVSLGGAIPVLLGLVGAALCATISRSSVSTLIKVLLCIVTTLVAWVLWFLLLVGLSMI